MKSTKVGNRRTVAVSRTFPEIVMSASDTGGCCFASASRRLLTLWSCSAFRQNGFKGHGRHRFVFRPREWLSVS